MRLRPRWKLQHVSLREEHILLTVLVLRGLAMCLLAAVPISFLHHGAHILEVLQQLEHQHLLFVLLAGYFEGFLRFRTGELALNGNGRRLTLTLFALGRLRRPSL